MPSSPSPSPPVYFGRFAPSPTGQLHLGSLLAALASWLRARSQGGQWLLRIEDIDPPREVPGASMQIIDALAAFGMTSDQPIVYQSDRSDLYAAALQRLIDTGLAFSCRCSRTDLLKAGGHHGRCRPDDGSKRQAAWRFLTPDCNVSFDDAIQGRQTQNVAREIGDFVLRRSEGLWAYQLAVVVDDADQGITEIVRGADLLDSTPRQILLQRALGLPTPAYAHIPVLIGDDGQKLSKQTYAMPVDPDHPMPALRHALRLLAIPADVLPAGGTPAATLATATHHFELSRLVRQPSLPPNVWRD